MKMELGIGQGIRQGTTQLGWGGGVAAIANHRNYFRCHGDDGDDDDDDDGDDDDLMVMTMAMLTWKNESMSLPIDILVSHL